jgi:hypothetical protein
MTIQLKTSKAIKDEALLEFLENLDDPRLIKLLLKRLKENLKKAEQSQN